MCKELLLSGRHLMEMVVRILLLQLESEMDDVPGAFTISDIHWR